MADPDEPGGLNRYTQTQLGAGGAPWAYVNAYRPINPPAGAEAVTCDLALDRGGTSVGAVADPEGRPLTGVLAAGLAAGYPYTTSLAVASFTAYGLEPNRPRQLAFVHRDLRLSTLVTLRDDAPGPRTVRLAPAGVIAGRLLDRAGRPVDADVGLMFEAAAAESLHSDLHHRSAPGEVQTDEAGRFRFDLVFPVAPFGLTVYRHRLPAAVAEQLRRLTVTAGEVKDLGDITVLPLKE